MGILSVVNLVSHLQNASRGRLGLTSCKTTKYNLALLLALQRSGFVSFVTRGGAVPPDPAHLSSYVPPPLTSANIAHQRLWVGLKYFNNEPVMRTLKAISSPKRMVNYKLHDLERIARGRDAGGRLIQRGLNLGECMYVTTSKGVLEVREAVERKVGGAVLCRVGP